MPQTDRIALTRELAEWFRMDRGDVSRALSAAGIQSVRVGGKGGGNGFAIESAVPALLAYKVGKLSGESSADRRNNAQAEKLELEAAILRRDFVPVEKGVAIWSRFLSTLAEIVQSSELPNEARERFVDRVHDQIGRLADDLRGEQSEPDSDD